jgi:hypothetical protein
MVLSEERKFIFVAVPKTASASIDQTLLPFGRSPLRKHASAEKIREIVPDWQAYFSFAVVRHPVDWLRSWHKFWTVPDQVTDSTKLRAKRNRLPSGMPFEEFVTRTITGDHQWRNFGGQAQRVCNKRGNWGLLVSKLYRFDRLNEHWPEILARAGLPPDLALKRENVSPRIQQSQELSAALLAQAQKHWARDFELYDGAG